MAVEPERQGPLLARLVGAPRVSLRACGRRRLLEMMRELKPPQLSSPLRRPYSIFGQRFMTTVSPAFSARAAAASLRTPSCIHTTLAPMATASSAIGPAASELRKMSTMSIVPVSFCGISDSRA